MTRDIVANMKSQRQRRTLGFFVFFFTSRIKINRGSNLLLGEFCAFLALQLVFVISGVKGHDKVTLELLWRQKRRVSCVS